MTVDTEVRYHTCHVRYHPGCSDCTGPGEHLIENIPEPRRYQGECDDCDWSTGRLRSLEAVRQAVQRHSLVVLR